MAECYQKMGDAESRKIYEQVVREYGDQKEAASLAKVRLGNESGRNPGLASFRQVWKLPKEATVEGKVPQDGRYVPYVGWGEKHGDLFLHDFATGQDRRLTNTAKDHMPRKPGEADEFAEEFSRSEERR